MLQNTNVSIIIIIIIDVFVFYCVQMLQQGTKGLNWLLVNILVNGNLHTSVLVMYDILIKVPIFEQSVSFL